MSHSPVWVAHPSSGRQLDVAPLFSTLAELDAPPLTPLSIGARDVIRRTIRTLNVTVHDHQVSTPEHLANLYRDLHLLEDMFDAMREDAIAE